MSNQNINIQESSSVKNKRYKLESREHFKSDLLIGFIFSVLFGVGTYFSMKYASEVAGLYFSMAILNAIVVGLITFGYLEWLYVYRKRNIEGEVLSEAIENAIERFQSLNTYNNILNNHLALTWKLMGPFSEIVNETTEKGGIVISANSIEYMAYLEKFLRYAKESYKAILCGYNEIAENDKIVKKCMYRPRWFFVKGDDLATLLLDANTKKPMMNREKYKWLLQVKEKKDLPRVRIMILYENELFEDFKNSEIRDQFLEMHAAENFKLFFASIDDIIDNLNKRKIDWKNMIEDYAIIDDSIVLKHDNDSSLLFTSIASSILPYREIFNLLDNDDSLPKNNKMFKILTKDKIGEDSWEVWIENLKGKHEYTSC